MTLESELNSLTLKICNFLKIGKFKDVLIELDSVEYKYRMPANNYDRFVNISPYNKDVSEKFKLDYINASFVTAGEASYIACQEPKKKYTKLFIDMIIKSGTKCVVSLNGECDYFSDFSFFENKVIQYNGLNFIEVRSYFIDGNEVKNVICLLWKDGDIIDPPMMDILSDVIKKTKSDIKIVHCKAGVGRTGTFIMYNALKKEKFVSNKKFGELLINLRLQRTSLVQNEEQLKYLHNIFVETS